MSAMRSDHTALLEVALHDGHVEHAVHALLVVLGDPLQAAQYQRRADTLLRAVATLQERLAQQRTAHSLRQGMCASTSDALLSYAQLQMYTLQALAPNSAAYNITTAKRVVEAVALDIQHLQAACANVMQAHDVLRTCFHTDRYGDPRQRVYGLQELPPCEVQCLEFTGDWRDDAALAAFLADATASSFDLARDAPIRLYTCVPHASTLRRSSPPSSSTCKDWVLVVVMHHIVTDPESSAIFWREFMDSYAGLRAGKPLPSLIEHKKPASPRPTYRDYAYWQHQQIQSGLLAPSLQFWIDHLTGSGDELEHLTLPFDHGGQLSHDDTDDIPDSLPQPRAGRVVFQSSPQLLVALRGLLAQEGASMFMGLLAVFHTLLSRVSQCDDLVIGTPVSMRGMLPQPGIEDIMGFFVNTLPFRLPRVPPQSPVIEFLRRVRDVVLAGFSHMQVPLQKMVEHVQLPRRHATSSLFQVLFAWEQSAHDSITKPTDGNTSSRCLTMKELALPITSDAKFDLMLSMRVGRDAHDRCVLEGTFEYPAHAFERATIERFASYFLQLSEGIVAHPMQTMAELPLLPTVEQRQLLLEWGAPAPATHPSPQFLDELVQDQVARSPDRVALWFEGTQWTYDQLWARSTLIMEKAQTFGIFPGAHVALFLDRGLANVAAILAVLRLRAVFIPLDPAFPADRIQYMLQDSQAQLVITQETLLDPLSALLQTASSSFKQERQQTSILVLEQLGNTTTARPRMRGNGHDSRCHGEARVDNDTTDTVAYMLYTSGSTGQPKGVLVTHANLFTTVQWTAREYALEPRDAMLQSTSSTLDGSLTQLFSPLAVGASAVITRKHGLQDLAYIARLLQDCTLCVFVPSYFALLVDYMDKFPPSVRYVILAGEAFPLALATRFYSKFASRERQPTAPYHDVADSDDGTCLVNEYGPTEASVTATFHRLPRSAAIRNERSRMQGVPIGRPIEGHHVVVVDNLGRLAAINMPGELLIGGPGVAMGYWRRESLTLERFQRRRMDEFGAVAAGDATMRWYRTGDLVKWLPSGDLLFLGRTDSQVKLHGMRIELPAIRHQLLQSEHLQDAEVVVERDRLVAYVIQRTDLSSRSSLNSELPTERESMTQCLRSNLERHLPSHMIPHEIHHVREWPRTPNGKLDVQALSSQRPRSHSRDQPSRSSKPHSIQSVALMSDVTAEHSSISLSIALSVLKQTWREALALEVDNQQLTTASFFELGGHSLAAIRAIALARSHGVVVQLEWFFRCRSLLEMAQEVVQAKQRGSSGGDNPRSSPVPANPTVVPLNWKPHDTAMTPLFLVHGIDGTVWNLLELASLLPFPVYGLQVATPQATAVCSVEAVAKQYWDAIRKVQSSGLYRIGATRLAAALRMPLPV